MPAPGPEPGGVMRWLVEGRDGEDNDDEDDGPPVAAVENIA